jgi:hypothetical protein
MANVEEMLVAHLVNALPKEAGVCDRVYAGVTLPPGYSPGKDGRAVLLRQAGGGTDYAGVMARHTVQVETYGPTEADAVDVDVWVRSALNTRRVCGGYARTQSLGNLLADPETEWRFVLSYYTVNVLDSRRVYGV